MKDWAVAFIAAVGVCSIVVWTTYILVPIFRAFYVA
jgi:hypothetical protein